MSEREVQVIAIQILDRLDQLEDCLRERSDFRDEMERLRTTATEAHQRIDSLEVAVRDVLTDTLHGPWYQQAPWRYIIWVAVLVCVLVLGQLQIIDLDRLEAWWGSASQVKVGITETTVPHDTGRSE